MIRFKNTKTQLQLEEIREFESNLGTKLPEDYKSHILTYNGGKPDKEFFEDLRISYFHPIKYGDFGTLEETLQSIKDVLPEGFLPFAYDEGGNQFCISLNEQNYGGIFIWYHDMGDNEDIVFLSNSFTEFIETLSEESEF